MIVDTAAGISGYRRRFSRTVQEVVVVVCVSRHRHRHYALIKLLNREYGIDRFHVLANMVRSAQEGGRFNRSAALRIATWIR